MSILQRFRSEVQRGLAEHQAKVLLQVLRQRLSELTLGDLREILASKIGRGLEALHLSELVGGVGVAEATAAAALPETRKGKQAGKQAGKARAGKKAGKKAGKAKAAPAKAGSVAGEFVDKVWATLKSAGSAMTSGELRATLGGSKSAVYRAVTELVRAGRIETAGKPARYTPKAESGPAGQSVAAEGGSKKQAKKTTAKKAAKAAGKKSGKATSAGKKGAAKAAGKRAARATPAGKKGAKATSAGKKGAKERSAQSRPAEAATPGEAKPGAAKAGEGVSGRTAEGRSQYDARVIAALRGAGDWVGSTQLREAVGGTDNQVRIALHRLIEAGQVVRRGERNSTAYRLGGS